MQIPAVESNDRPRSMKDESVRKQRKAMLGLPHIAPLARYVEILRHRDCVEVPDFDPCDGGVDAKFLFLFEKPGPMTAKIGKRVGSGYISRDNDDPTAEATFYFMQQAQIPRRLTVSWNVVPWWNGTRKVASRELQEGIEKLNDLVRLLPNLKAVVLVGSKARKAAVCFKGTNLVMITSDHPSPLVRARWPHRWKAIPLEWAKVTEFIKEGATM